ncbi:hypothetical protein [Brevundimonas sp.]|uniref:hypothetical protein n=1 Tax=Brevundimonas sp. TaxID=1871086 RepID=UPI0035661D18
MTASCRLAQAGKIVVVLQDTVQAQDGRDYGATSPIRGAGPTEPAKRGAIGYVLRSLGTHDHRFAHTGATVAAGVPAFRLEQDGTDYFNTHHTADDRLDRIDPKAMDQNVAAWAAFLWLLANSDVDFRAMRPAAAGVQGGL